MREFLNYKEYKSYMWEHCLGLICVHPKCNYKKSSYKRKSDTQKWRRQCGHGAQGWSDVVAISQVTASSHQKLEEVRKDSPRTFIGIIALAFDFLPIDTALRLLASELCERIKIYCINPQICDNCYRSHRKIINNILRLWHINNICRQNIALGLN